MKVAITGGISVGKSRVCDDFKKLGIPIYNTDKITKLILNTHETLKTFVKKEFGEECFYMRATEGREPYEALNRRVLGKIIFNDKSKLEKLEKVVHPIVWEDYNYWHQEMITRKFPYTLYESAILFEKGNEDRFDKIIVVTAPEEIRMKWAIEREVYAYSEDDREKDRKKARANIEAKMKNQMPQEEKTNRADYIVNNDEYVWTSDQVLTIHNQILQAWKKE